MAPYYYEEELIFGILSGLVTGFPSVLIGVATYVLTAMALYTIAQRRGLNNPWLAWIPVVNLWLLGSLSDQYRYVVRGENTARRKWLLGLSIATAVLWTAAIVVAVVMAGMLVFNSRADVFAPAMTLLGILLPLAAVTIAKVVIRCMALYDVYKSMDPANCVIFLVLSILFKVTEPFFLFFSRNKDNGMPPRRQPEPAYTECEQPQWQSEEPQKNFWETENKDYL